MTQYILDDDARVSLVGRYSDLGSGYQTGWGGSQRRFTVSGTVAIAIACAIVDTGAGTNSYVGISVDYGDVEYYELTTTAETFTGTKSQSFTMPDTGEHDIILWYMLTPAAQWFPTVDKIILESIGIDDAATLTAWPQTGLLDVGCIGDSWANWIYGWPHHLNPSLFSIWPVSNGGFKASDLDAKVDYIFDGLSESDPALDYVVIGVSVNDYLASVTLAAFEVSLASVVDKVRVQQPTALIVLPQHPDNTGASRTYSQYGPAMDSVASTREGVYYLPDDALGAVTWEADNAHLDSASRQLFADHIGAYISTLEAQIMSGKIYKIDGTYIRSFYDINYSNPTAVNATAAISPYPGEHITSTSKLVTITSSSGTVKFWPKGGLTSRTFWGTGASAAATITINPVNLVIGCRISIALYDGESCILEWDGTDFTKVDGVSIPCICKMGEDESSAAAIVITDATLTVVPCNKILYDNTGQMGSIAGNGTITPIRSGNYVGSVRAAWIAGAGGTTDHLLQHRIMYGSGATNMINLPGGWVVSKGMTIMPIGGEELIPLTTSEILEMYVFHGGVISESLSIYRAIDTSAQFWFQIVEINPY